MRDTFVARLSSMAERDPRIMLLTGDLGFGVLDSYARRFPKQYLNVGVAEQNMTGLATGLALEGHIVFTYSIGNFPTLRTLEQIRNGPCYHNLNVNVVSVGAGFSYGQLGFSHHATEDIAIMRSLPNSTVLVPGDLWEASEATEALAQRSGLGYLRIDKSHALTNKRAGEEFTVGKARRLREGNSICFVTCGGILAEVLKAADLLAQRGIQARVLSMHSVTALDQQELNSAVKETAAIFTVEEHTVHGGLGGAVAETLLESGNTPETFYRFAMRDGLCSVVGEQSYLRALCGLDCESLVAKVSSLLG